MDADPKHLMGIMEVECANAHSPLQRGHDQLAGYQSNTGLLNITSTSAGQTAPIFSNCRVIKFWYMDWLAEATPTSAYIDHERMPRSVGTGIPDYIYFLYICITVIENRACSCGLRHKTTIACKRSLRHPRLLFRS